MPSPVPFVFWTLQANGGQQETRKPKAAEDSEDDSSGWETASEQDIASMNEAGNVRTVNGSPSLPTLLTHTPPLSLKYQLVTLCI